MIECWRNPYWNEQTPPSIYNCMYTKSVPNEKQFSVLTKSLTSEILSKNQISLQNTILMKNFPKETKWKQNKIYFFYFKKSESKVQTTGTVRKMKSPFATNISIAWQPYTLYTMLYLALSPKFFFSLGLQYCYGLFAPNYMHLSPIFLSTAAYKNVSLCE